MTTVGAGDPDLPFYPDQHAPLPAGARFSFAQNWEDAYLHRVFGDVDAGFYVDVGALFPATASVTKFFYDHGWSGINIEPGSSFDDLARQRPRDINLRVAVGDRRGTARFHEVTGAPGNSHLEGLSTVGMRELDHVVREVEIRPLAEVLAEHAAEREIHFLKVDVEGAEREVLVSNDWSRFRPWIVVVEATIPDSPETCHELWEDVLTGAGYIRAFFDGLNMYYCRDDKATLAGKLDRPINVFDGFRKFEPEVAEINAALAEVKRRMPQLVSERDAASRERDAVTSERDALITERDSLTAEREALTAERAARITERDALITEREALTAERDALTAERDALTAERDALTAEREALTAERDALLAERERERQQARRDGSAERLLRLQTRYRLDGATRELRFGLWLARRLRQADAALARLVGRRYLALRPMKARFLANAPVQPVAPGIPPSVALSHDPIPAVGPKLEAVIAEIRAAEARTAARERATAEGLEAVLLALAARASKS
jgi:FkbM family methyltransferase